MNKAAALRDEARRSTRRFARSPVELVASGWDTPRLHRTLDLSPLGMRIASGTLLSVDEVVAVSFTPPGWWLHGELTVFSRVARIVPRRGVRAAAMGLEFLDLPLGAEAHLSRALRGTPPPLPEPNDAAASVSRWAGVSRPSPAGDTSAPEREGETVALDVDRADDPTVLMVDALVLEAAGELLTGGGRCVWPRLAHRPASPGWEEPIRAGRGRAPVARLRAPLCRRPRRGASLATRQRI